MFHSQLPAGREFSTAPDHLFAAVRRDSASANCLRLLHHFDPNRSHILWGLWIQIFKQRFKHIFWSVVDPNPHGFWSAGSESALSIVRAKITLWSTGLKCWMFSFEGWGFFCSLNVRRGGQGINKLKFRSNYFFNGKISNFWSSMPRIRFRIETKIHNTAFWFFVCMEGGNF